jgi:heptosyltransferase-2
VKLGLLVKPGLTALWKMHPAIADVLCLHPGWGGAWRAGREIRARGIGRVYVFPHSFRSALPPFLARTPERIGMPGHGRDFMLTEVVPPHSDPSRPHQQFEYADLLLPGYHGKLPAPELRIGASATHEANRMLEAGSAWIGCIPGAARGPSKQWPADHFIAVGRRLVAHDGVRMAVTGAPGQETLCETVASGIGKAAVNLAGRLSFATWSAVLKRCRVVVANDSGGMHLAAGLGTPVVALFGHTDPDRTGPLGTARVLQHGSVRGRDIARDSRAARISLASIRPDEVYDAVRDLAGFA